MQEILRSARKAEYIDKSTHKAIKQGVNKLTAKTKTVLGKSVEATIGIGNWGINEITQELTMKEPMKEPIENKVREIIKPTRDEGLLDDLMKICR